MSLINHADGSGRIDIGGKSWPVSYQVVAEDDASGGKTVHVELSMPRDWLIERGFESAARLIRENGVEIAISAPRAVDTSAPVAIQLRSGTTKLGSDEEASRRFPELTTH